MDSVDIEVLRAAETWRAAGRRVALGTIVKTWGSAPRPVGAMVAVRDDGLVKAVSYIDTETREERQIRCRVCVVAASACESARLLLNSKSPSHPNGLANGSGVVGVCPVHGEGTALMSSMVRRISGRWYGDRPRTMPATKAPRTASTPMACVSGRTRTAAADSTPGSVSPDRMLRG